MNKVNIKFLTETAAVPTSGSEYSAGYDVYADVPEGGVVIKSGECRKIGTGIAMTPPEGMFVAMFARSGMAAKRGLRPANCVGVLDQDYTGEYIVPLYNDSDEDQKIFPGDRIAQIIFLPYVKVEFNEVDELEDTERGDGGFGHTGTN